MNLHLHFWIHIIHNRPELFVLHFPKTLIIWDINELFVGHNINQPEIHMSQDLAPILNEYLIKLKVRTNRVQ